MTESPLSGVSPAMLDQTFQLALAAQQANELEKAEKLYRLLLAANPHHLNALANLSTLSLNLGNFEQALLLIEQALAIDQNHATLHYNYGKILMRVKLYAEALRRYERAISLQPKTAEFHSSRGAALHELARYDEAVESYAKAIMLNPHAAEFYNNRGNSLGHAARFQEAIADYSTAITLDPSFADAYWNRGLLQLMHGDFANGLQGYEWRWKRAHFVGDLRYYEQPLWLGDAPIVGKTILIYPEQGLGDMMQFCRYVPMLEALGAHVILEVQAPLVAFLSTVSPTATVVAKGSALPAFDLQCPIMSLPLAFHTRTETIPGNTPYLSVSAEKRAHWSERLGPKTKPRIGLVWSGSATHANDHNRSISLAAFVPLFDLPFEFHSLQKEVRAEDKPHLSHLIDHREALLDFTDTAALVEAMDLIISVDTSVTHVAGALGKSLWILLPTIPDYRWLLGREDTPWYPQATLFRQSNAGDWQSVIGHVKMTLATF